MMLKLPAQLSTKNPVTVRDVVKFKITKIWSIAHGIDFLKYPNLTIVFTDMNGTVFWRRSLASYISIDQVQTTVVEPEDLDFNVGNGFVISLEHPEKDCDVLFEFVYS